MKSIHSFLNDFIYGLLLTEKEVQGILNNKADCKTGLNMMTFKKNMNVYPYIEI